MADPDVRWQQRLAHFDRALELLREGLRRDPDTLSDLEKEGLVQRFEYTFELARKTLKDFLAWSGVDVEPLTARATLRQAYAVRILADGQVWLDMLERRNLLSHTYDAAVFDEAIVDLRSRFLQPIIDLHTYFQAQREG